MTDNDIIRVSHQGRDIAMLIPAGYGGSGVEFLTPGDYSQQLAVMRHPAGHVIPSHTHNLVERRVEYTQEVLFIRAGKLRVDLYADSETFLQSLEAGPGDVVFLCSGGHGFTVLKDLDMIEVKQGPYAGDGDKTVFTPHRQGPTGGRE